AQHRDADALRIRHVIARPGDLRAADRDAHAGVVRAVAGVLVAAARRAAREVPVGPAFGVGAEAGVEPQVMAALVHAVRLLLDLDRKLIGPVAHVGGELLPGDVLERVAHLPLGPRIDVAGRRVQLDAFALRGRLERRLRLPHEVAGAQRTVVTA